MAEEQNGLESFTKFRVVAWGSGPEGLGVSGQSRASLIGGLGASSSFVVHSLFSSFVVCRVRLLYRPFTLLIAQDVSGQSRYVFFMTHDYSLVLQGHTVALRTAAASASSRSILGAQSATLRAAQIQLVRSITDSATPKTTPPPVSGAASVSVRFPFACRPLLLIVYPL
jgi:hypothetical protein